MSRLFRTGLRGRLLLLILLTIIPILGLTLYINFELRRLVVEDVREATLQLAQLAASDQNDTIKDIRQLLFALAQLPEVQQVNPATCSALFSQLLKQYPQYAHLGVIELDGDVSCSARPDDIPLNLADQRFFQQALETGQFSISDYGVAPLTGQAMLSFGYPLVNEARQVQGVVFASLDLVWLNQLAAQAQLPEGSAFTLIDRNGTILVRYPDSGQWVGQSFPEVPIIEIILTQRGEGTAEAEGVDGVRRLFAFTPLRSAPGAGNVYVSVGIPTPIAFSDANRVLIRSLVGIGLVTILTLAAVWYGSNLFILRPVNGLVETSKRLSMGSLAERTGLSYSQDELGQLALAFDEMADSLERRVAERDQAKEALQESQRALATLLSNLPGMAYRSHNDARRTMEFVSEGCLELTGYYPADLIGNARISYSELIHPEDQKTVWDTVQATLREDKPFQLIYRILTIKGEEKWVWEQGRAVFSLQGQILALEGFITDTTERVQAYQLLEQRVADRTRELSALYQVTAVASESLNSTTTLERSLEQILTVMRCKIGIIHLFDPPKEMLQLAVCQGLPPDVVARIDSLRSGQDLAGWIIEHGEPLVVSDITQDPRATPLGLTGSTYAYVGAPMRARGRVLGVLSVIGEAGQNFEVEEVALLASIADEVGVAVENSQLYEAERRQRRQASTLLQVASVVGSTLELDEVLARILDQLQRVVDYDSASVQLLGEDGLKIIAARGFTDVQQLLGITFSPGEIPNYKVITQGQPLSLADAPRHYSLFHNPPFDHIRSWLGVPLRVQEQIIGMITVDRQKPGGYSEEEVRLSTAFAGQAALALENARLYQQAEQLAVMEERSRLARELHDSVTQSLYSQTLFAEVGRRAAEAGNLEQVVDYLARIGQITQQALKEMRLLVYELRGPTLEAEGLVGALQYRLDAVEKRAGIEARLEVGAMINLPALVEEGLYRITQEALNNALKHALGTSVVVKLTSDNEEVTLEVVDDGQGFDPAGASKTGGIGLASMRERAEQLGGSLTILAKPGAGTQVKVKVPTRRSWTKSLLPPDKILEKIHE